MHYMLFCCEFMRRGSVVFMPLKNIHTNVKTTPLNKVEPKLTVTRRMH